MKSLLCVQLKDGSIIATEIEPNRLYKEWCTILLYDLRDPDQPVDVVREHVCNYFFKMGTPIIVYPIIKRLQDIPKVYEHTYVFGIDGEWKHRHWTERKGSQDCGTGVWCVVNDCYISDDEGGW